MASVNQNEGVPLLLPSDDPLPYDEQLRALTQALVNGTRRHVVLHGAPGSGKTRLARAFAEQHEDHFVGGSHFVTGPASVASFRWLGRIDSHQPALLVLDAIEATPIPVLVEGLRYLRSDYPETRVLMTSRIEIYPTLVTETVAMPPLTVAQVLPMLRAAFSGDPERLDVLASRLSGNAAAINLVSRHLAAGMPPERIVEWTESGAFPVARDPNGRPLGEKTMERRELNIALTEVSEELIQHLAGHPELVYRLDPRKFEQLVAELYRRRGYAATLTPASGDKGIDVYVVSREGLGETLWVVQAKRWAPDRKIQAGVVRELYGTVNLANASAGILLTTSFFEPGARAIESELRYRIKLEDYLGLQHMLREPRLNPDT